MNYMKEVAKMLGVEIGERFKIDFSIYNSCNSNFDYYLSREGIVLDKEGHGCCSNDILCELLRGNYIIKRKPWKPNNNDVYYIIDEKGYSSCEQWCNDSLDLNYYKIGNCYRTAEEAEANREKWNAFYASDEVLEV